jgi:hypothetical protein
MRYRGRDFTVARATLGAFELTPDSLRHLYGEDPLPVDTAAEAPARQTAGDMVRVVDGLVYIGRDPSSPQVGDLRISYTIVSAPQVSIIARQAGNGFAPYQTRAGDALLMIEKGLLPAAQMFKAAQDENAILTWILRGVGALVMFIGFGLIFRPLGVLADVLPFLGDIMRLGTGAIGFALTAVFSAVTIGIAWLYYRPVIGILVLLAGIGIAVGMWFLGRKRRAAPVAMPAGMAPAGPPGYGMPPQAPMGQMPQWQHQQVPQGQWQQQQQQQMPPPQGPVQR